jgi:hypothetical protein
LDTTHQYLEVDVEMKRRALEQCRTAQPQPRRYRVPDPVLAMLEQLQ